MNATSATGGSPSVVERVRPGAGDDPDVVDAVLLLAGPERVAHRRRGLDGDDLGHLRGERQGVPAGARADVEPAILGLGQRQQRVQRLLAGPPRIGHEQRGHRRVEVAIRHLADRSTCSRLARTRSAQAPSSSAAVAVVIASRYVAARIRGCPAAARGRRACRCRGSRRRPGPRSTRSRFDARTGPRPRSPIASSTSSKASASSSDRVRAAALGVARDDHGPVAGAGRGDAAPGSPPAASAADRPGR